MDDIRRYNPEAVYAMGSVWAGMAKDAEGSYVRYTDYAALTAELEALRRDAEASDLLRRVVMFAEGKRAPAWMPQRFLDECRDFIAARQQEAARES